MHAEYDLHVENIQKTLSILFFSTRIISWGCGQKQGLSNKENIRGGHSEDTPKTEAPCNSRCSTVKTPTPPPLLPNLCPKLQIFTDNGIVSIHLNEIFSSWTYTLYTINQSIFSSNSLYTFIIFVDRYMYVKINCKLTNKRPIGYFAHINSSL